MNQAMLIVGAKESWSRSWFLSWSWSRSRSGANSWSGSNSEKAVAEGEE